MQERGRAGGFFFIINIINCRQSTCKTYKTSWSNNLIEPYFTLFKTHIMERWACLDSFLEDAILSQQEQLVQLRYNFETHAQSKSW